MKKLLCCALLLSGCSIGSFQEHTAEEWHQLYVDESYERVDYWNQLMEAQDDLENLQDCVNNSDDLDEAQDCTYYY